MTTGNSEFNEVFFDDVFVPDDDVVGPVDGGWTVARATPRQRERQHRRWRRRHVAPAAHLVAPFDAHPERPGWRCARVGRYIGRAPCDGPAQPARRVTVPSAAVAPAPRVP